MEKGHQRAWKKEHGQRRVGLSVGGRGWWSRGKWWGENGDNCI